MTEQLDPAAAAIEREGHRPRLEEPTGRALDVLRREPEQPDEPGVGRVGHGDALGAEVRDERVHRAL